MLLPTLTCKEKLENNIRWRAEAISERPLTQMFIQ